MSTSSAFSVVKGNLVSTENYTWNTADSLGKGASAVVYLGRHKTTGDYVAVKVFHDQVYQGHKTDNLRELELLSQLRHENIIKLLAVEKLPATDNMVIVMEYCEGGSIHHMLEQPQYHYGLCEEEFVLVMYHVCSGMEYLQQQNVIHRDIKPGNIMRSVTRDGFSLYKLTDFGGARNLYEDEQFQSLYGTEEYLHPVMYERAVLRLPNSQLFDAKVDLWSLGVTFYHIATGQLPFQPHGGRSNKRTMFEIITQKESGVISGVQTSANGQIIWKRDLPESSPLSSGLKSLVIPLLAGLMEQDSTKMITYRKLFHEVSIIKRKIIITIFYYNKCQEFVIYAEPNTTLSILKEEIASVTDVAPSEQILIVGGKALEELVDPFCSLLDYPTHLRSGSIFLFQREITEVHKLPKPEIPSPPEFLLTDIENDAKLAHRCTSWGELMKRKHKKIIQHQEKLMNGLLFFRVHVEVQLEASKISLEYVKQLLDEVKRHMSTLFDLVEILQNIVTLKRPGHHEASLSTVLCDPIINRVYDMAIEKMTEIKDYTGKLTQRMEDLKGYERKISALCLQEKCDRKLEFHLSVITGIYNRFRRDKTVKDHMTSHDVDIHRFEGYKLNSVCVTMKSVYSDHCLPQLGIVYKNCMHVCESLTKCLARVFKVEKNIAALQKCVDMVITKLQDMKTSGLHLSSLSGTTIKTHAQDMTEQGASFATAVLSEMTLPAFAGLTERSADTQQQGLLSASDGVRKLTEELEFVMNVLEENSHILFQSLDESLLQSARYLDRDLMPYQN